jgi:proteasome assembly chaperone (PAC2) family protein
MEKNGIIIEERPDLKAPVLIAGFDGWGNALGISTAMVSYIVGKRKAGAFARIDPDPFYRYDGNRPVVDIQEGNLVSLSMPGGTFYAAGMDDTQADLVLLRADEPVMAWQRFADDFFSLCRRFGVSLVITLGGMYDQVIHTDRVISGIASSEPLSERLAERGILPIDYNGPSAVHSILHTEGRKQGLDCISLWGHCPFYLQETTHFGLLARLGDLLADLGGFDIDTAPLDRQWTVLEKKIQELIDADPKLREMIGELRRAKVRGSWQSVRASTPAKGGKVIRLRDFLDP